MTCARVRPAPVRVERYGRDDRFYFVLHNPTETAVRARLAPDARAIDPARYAARLLPAGESLPEGPGWTVPLAPRDTQVLFLER
ncbi:MAG: hypothetical protein IT210_18720 [Armatimonadetes bacterium]|nr:hypothetical protein [Armatimonadota bacterium]